MKKTASKRDVIIFLADGKKRKLVNDHQMPVNDFIHPLNYSPDYKNHLNIRVIPMNYKFQRKFYERYLKLKK